MTALTYQSVLLYVWWIEQGSREWNRGVLGTRDRKRKCCNLLKGTDTDIGTTIETTQPISISEGSHSQLVEGVSKQLRKWKATAVQQCLLRLLGTWSLQFRSQAVVAARGAPFPLTPSIRTTSEQPAFEHWSLDAVLLLLCLIWGTLSPLLTNINLVLQLLCEIGKCC